jgi:molybdopterin converting factor small subunit
MTIDVKLPGLIAAALGASHLAIDAPTLAAAIERLRDHPKLGPLIFDQRGAVRPHVLIFHNDTATKHLPGLDVPLQTGDTLAVVQAVSGG